MSNEKEQERTGRGEKGREQVREGTSLSEEKPQFNQAKTK